MTAVEWFMRKTFGDEMKVNEYQMELYEQAKAMEKEQFEDTFEEGFESAYQYFVNGKDFVKFQDYYNETYGGN